MTSRFFLFLLGGIFLLLSCKNNTISTHYENGKVHETYQYRGDSLKHGLYKRYSDGGVLLEESIYMDGYLDSERKIYSTAGNLEIIENYSNKMLNGPFKIFHVSGKVKQEASYTDNVLNGLVKGYYPTGALKEEVTFENNVENGPFKEYHQSGHVMWKGTYRNGDHEFGLLEKFDEKGVLVRKMMCDERGICHTTWTTEKEDS